MYPAFGHTGREVLIMARFYDPKDETDRSSVETVLRKGGIEYFLRRERGDTGMLEIYVAEEDLPRAEELLIRGKGGNE